MKYTDRFILKKSEVMKLKFGLVFILLFFLVYGAISQSVIIDWPEIKDSSNIVDTHTKPIENQVRKTYNFASSGVYVSNKFDGARLNFIRQLNDSTFECTVVPENHPINNSAWYAFKVWTDKPKTVYFNINYRNGRHRYFPKLSNDGLSWVPIDSLDFLTSNSDSLAIFRIRSGRDTTWVAAQEIITSKMAMKWMDGLETKAFVKKKIIGYSALKKPIPALIIAESIGKNLLVILSRQHPPEITGYKEMMSFVETIAGKSWKAKRFRKKFEIIVVPMINPDGVDNGHWRHNVGGIDLNRDWRYFYQPETRAFRKFVLGEIEKKKLVPCYGVDFHSTQTDIFYLSPDEDLPEGKGISRKWLESVNKRFPANKFNPLLSGVEGQFSKNWFLHELKVEAITYEVGDTTGREVIRKRGKNAALQLMQILLKKFK